MRTSKDLEKHFLIITIMIITVTACNQPYSQQPSTTNTPHANNLFATPINGTSSVNDIQIFATGTALALQTATPVNGVPQTSDIGIMGTVTAQFGENIISSAFQEVDQSLSRSMKANIAYNAPTSMKLSETVTIVLFIDPFKTPEQVAAEVVQDSLIEGQSEAPIVTATVEITDRMKAELITDDKDAFIVQSIPNNPEQPISSVDSTRWAWLLTAQKPGPQKLTLVISRLVKYAGLEYWRPVETYKAEINVKVTISQQIASVDWKWLVGLAIPMLGIPSLWGYFANRMKKKKRTK